MDVSVIVPIHNSGKYLDRCLYSLVSQTQKINELILVDDGSTDDSLSICREFQKLHDNIHIITQKKSGVSTARNSGLEFAHSDYIMFCDSDDYVMPDYVECLFGAIQNADIAACGYIRKREREIVYQLMENHLSKEQFIFHTLCTPYISGACWNKIFRRRLIAELRFDETLSIGEDMLFVFSYLQKCKSVAYVIKPCYVYVMNTGSALQKNYSEKMLSNTVIDNINAANKIYHSYSGNNKYISKCISYRIVRSSLWVFFQMVICSDYRKEYGKIIQKNFKMNLKNYKEFNCGTAIQNISVQLIFCFPYLFYLTSSLGIKIFPKVITKYLV